jgi:hypothetical protein
MTLQRLAAFGVFVAAVSSLVVGWSLFWALYLTGERSITLYVNPFGEFWIEFVGLTLAVVFLPTLLYQLDREVFGGD